MNHDDMTEMESLLDDIGFLVMTSDGEDRMKYSHSIMKRVRAVYERAEKAEKALKNIYNATHDEGGNCETHCLNVRLILSEEGEKK